MSEIILFDLETTGLNVNNDRIVQIAMIRYNIESPFDPNDFMKYMIDPCMPIDPSATEVHGISNDDVQGCNTFGELAGKIKDFIGGGALCAYNLLRFDLPMLMSEFYRYNIEFDIENRLLIDPYRIFAKFNPRNLATALEHYCGLEIENAHDAMSDTRALLDIFKTMIPAHQISSLEMAQDLSFNRGEMVDVAGKFIRDEKGIIIYNFGKWKGEPVSEHFEYVDWMLRGDFHIDTLKWCEKMLKNTFDRIADDIADDDLPFS